MVTAHDETNLARVEQDVALFTVFLSRLLYEHTIINYFGLKSHVILTAKNVCHMKLMGINTEQIFWF